MKVTGENVEADVAVAHCAHCGERFYRSRSDHRFCSPICHYEFHQTERRAALAWYRAKVRREKQQVAGAA